MNFSGLPEKNKIFYVYIYLDPRKPGNYEYNNYRFNYEPFYVGKGKNNRYWSHISEAIKNRKYYNMYLFNKIRKIILEDFEIIIIKLQENLIEYDAFLLESKIINLIGRRDLKKGVFLIYRMGERF